MARLRQILIMAARMLVVAALLFAVGRSLASGWIGSLAGGRPESVIVLLDRSSSMQVQRFGTERTKVSAGLEKIADMLTTIGHKGEIILIDSNTMKPRSLPSPDALEDLPDADASSAACDIPGMVETAYPYISNNKSGRTDVWLCSDSQTEDRDPESSRWSILRDSFSRLEGVRFQVLNYADTAKDNFAVRVENVIRGESQGDAFILVDITVNRPPGDQEDELELKIAVNGGPPAIVKVDQGESKLLGHKIAVDQGAKSGWGRVELPADSNPGDNTFYFAYARRPVQKTVIVTDDRASIRALELAAGIALDRATRTEAEVFDTGQIQEIDWKNTACIVCTQHCLMISWQRS